MKASVVIVAFRAGDTLLRCLESLAPERDELDVLVVDNGARGAEIERAAEFGWVRVLRPGANVGFATGCNLAAREARGEILVFLNPDTVAAPGAVVRLAERLEDRSIAIAMARLRLLAQPALLNSSGAVIHITGMGWSGGHGRPADEVTDVREIAYANGSALAIRADVFRQLGGFTDELFIYLEDMELGWRAHMRGLRVVVDPAADVFHDYEHTRNETKLYYMERNRLVFVLSAYSGRLLALLAPVLLAAEVGLVLVALRGGWARDKAAGWAWCVRNAGWLRRHRAETQALRSVEDRELARFLTPVFDPGMVEVPRLAAVANPLLRRYWSLVRSAL